jgi:serine/threonine-protein kinase HipA
MRTGEIHYNEKKAGLLTEDDQGNFFFAYDSDYLRLPDAQPIGVSLPLRKNFYTSDSLFPFFDGMIPEGWYLDIVAKTLKLDPEDRFGILLATGSHGIGVVTVHAVEEGTS